MDIEFIICWEDRTWTTEIYEYKKEDLQVMLSVGLDDTQSIIDYDTMIGSGGVQIDYDKICTERMEKIIKEIASGPDCPRRAFPAQSLRGGPVHVGIYRSAPL